MMLTQVSPCGPFGNIYADLRALPGSIPKKARITGIALTRRQYPIAAAIREQQGDSHEMPFDAIALVLIAAVVHVGWNRLLHQSGDREAVMALSGWFTGGAMIPLMIIWAAWEVGRLI